MTPSVDVLPDYRRDPELVAAVQHRDTTAILCGRAHRKANELRKAAEAASDADADATATEAAHARQRYRELQAELDRAEARVGEAVTLAQSAVNASLRAALFEKFQDALNTTRSSLVAGAWGEARSTLDHVVDQFPDLVGLIPGEQGAAEQLASAIIRTHRMYHGETVEELDALAARIGEAITRAELREAGLRDEEMR